MMLIGYARISRGGGAQSSDLQIDALEAAGVDRQRIYRDVVSGAQAERPGLDECLRSLRQGDTLVVWRLDRLGRSLKHLLQTVEELGRRDIGFRSLTEGIDTTTPTGTLVFHILGALAQFERDLIRERVNAGLRAARARGRLGGRPAVPVERLLAAAAAMKDEAASPRAIAREFGIGLTTLYRHVAPDGTHREPLIRRLEARRTRKTRRRR